MRTGKRLVIKERKEADETPIPLSDRQPGTLELDTCPVTVEGVTGWVKSKIPHDKLTRPRASFTSGSVGVGRRDMYHDCTISRTVSVDENTTICVPLTAIRDENHLV